MARTKVRLAQLTLPRRYNAMARDWLFGKLDAVHMSIRPPASWLRPAQRRRPLSRAGEAPAARPKMKSSERTITMERNLTAEEAEIAEIIRGVLAVQARTAAEENRPLRRATHAKGVCARAVFEVLERRSRTRSGAGSTARQGDLR